MPGKTKQPSGKQLALLAFGALGVVYGDIGTSPLYAFKECFFGPHSFPVTTGNVLGILSLIFWSLNFVVTFKYLSMVMRADNRGEGGILALLALVRPTGPLTGSGRLLIATGLFGSALLYGDGIITPAISVLSAVEGLSVATPALQHWVVPVAFLIILALFALQRRGTAGIGAVFGPVTATWFICIAVLGIMGISREPGVLRAIDPRYAVDFFAREGLTGITILAAIILVVTGGEALYADMGHFGRRPIRLAWFTLVLPALVLNYFGQGALILNDPGAARNPFYALVPSWALYPMVGIATAAAVVASQALISGAFSLTRQAIQLGYCPRMTIVHTSSSTIGQIYMPTVNTILMLCCLGLVVAFQNASALALTYGVALSGTMTITTILFAVVMLKLWGWSKWKAGAITLLFLVVDLAFVGANMLKVPNGGWLPLLVAGVVYLLMSTWKKGRVRLSALVRENTLPMELFLDDIRRSRPYRVPGTAVFMTSYSEGAPPVLLHHLKHNKVLHEKVMLMSVHTEEIPQVSWRDRVKCSELGEGFYLVMARYGFMETPDVPEVLRSLGRAEENGKPVAVKLADTTFYLGRETLIAIPRGRRSDGAVPE
ncbi:MAG TPA: KUP/HAK/KT family potassium transporter, partial [Gemmatimonadales bacterium]|nr:KUP/HAK/KT family potassium transporter [Gemmatimonadales bacterium]